MPHTPIAPPISKDPMSTTTEFTQNWLQALMQAATNESARRIRPWMTDLGLLTASEAVEGQVDAAKRIWGYGHANGLTELLSMSPLRQPDWRFEEDECFQFRHTGPTSSVTDEASFLNSLGIVPMQVELVGAITQSDWTNMLRREAVRRAKGLNVQAIPTGSLVEIPCDGHWDTRAWSIAFRQPDWLVLDQPGVFHATRPSREVIDAAITNALTFANRHFTVTGKPTQFHGNDVRWMASVGSLYDWHRKVLLNETSATSGWLRRVWNCVWPVLYRERNRLRGECSLNLLRAEIAECFTAAPLLTEWMFVFGRLVCEVEFERGLGIAGDFQDA